MTSEIITRLDRCAKELQARAEEHGRGTDFWHYWADRAQLARGWKADLELGHRNDVDTVEEGLEEFERMTRA